MAGLLRKEVRIEARRIDALRVRYRAFREKHGRKPFEYYRGRERWTALPRDFTS